jgi:hypothetical protein
MATSFAADIAPMLAPYRDNMLWRLDLTDYEAVKANATAIRDHIDPSGGDMPPPPLPPLDPGDIGVFQAWITEGCPP